MCASGGVCHLLDEQVVASKEKEARKADEKHVQCRDGSRE